MSIAVVGDSIIDEYFFVKSDRISPEFPIPIFNLENFYPYKSLPGGASNVCYQFVNFDIEKHYFGFADFESLSVLEEYIETENCFLLDKFSKIPRKKRFYQENFPLCRIDVESKNYGLSDDKLNILQEKICNSLKLNYCDIVIFSDYGKGIFENFDIQKYIKSAGSSLKIVDPKNGPVSKWLGCDIIKPNFKEAEIISGKKDWKEQASFFKKNTNAQHVLITQGGDGVVGIIDNDYFEYKPQYKTKPVSVVGAGDCFVSLLAIGLSNSLNVKQSVEYAFYGSSLYVKNKHNTPIHPADLCRNKLIDNPEILRKRNFSLCFTNGCFDFGLTPAHVDLLRYAKTKKEKLVVALNSDLSIKKLKGEARPIFSFEDRAKILSSLECVDYIVEFEEETPANLLNKIQPDLIVKGGDYAPENVVGHGFFPIDIFSFVNSCSTTEKIIKLNE